MGRSNGLTFLPASPSHTLNAEPFFQPYSFVLSAFSLIKRNECQFFTNVPVSHILGLVAIGFGVYEFVHNEISNGSLSFLLGVVILNFAINGTGAFGD